MQQQVDDPPSLPVGTEVSAKYKGAFCEAKVRKVVRNIKVKVSYKQGLGSGIVSDDVIKSGVLRVGAVVEIKHPDKRESVEATITKIQDCSQYTVVFDDGDITTLRRTALCLKSGRHFNESETLDQLPLTHPEHFGNPVIGGRRGRRSRHLHEESSDEEDENDPKEVINEKEEHVGKIVCVESTETKKKDKEKWFPGLVVSPTAQVTVRIRVKDEYLVRSFKDGRYYTVPKKEATEFTRELATKQDGPAVQAAIEYLDNDVLPPHWDRDALFGLGNSSSEYEGEVDSDSSDDEPREEKDHFVAQLYKYMDDRGTPLNKVPSITNRDVDLYRLFRAVQKLGGYNRVTSQNQWKAITIRLGFTPGTVSVTNLVKQAYKKFLQPFEEFNRKLGCSMSMTPRNASRSKGRSLVRANSVASPKPEVKEKETKVNQNAEESENTSESSMDVAKSKRKLSTGSNKVKNLIEKFEEKTKEESELQTTLPIMKSAKQAAKEDGSTPSSVIGSRKEKTIKKNPPTEERRGRKKKEVVETEKQPEKSPETITVADFPVEIGDKLKVYYHEKKVTYEAKVIDLSIQQGTPLYLVHYTGWNTRYDEWVPKERIAENISNSKIKRSKAVGNNQKVAVAINEEAKSGNNEKSNTIMAMMKTGTVSKRGRGRSDSQPPRSTTPSSLISNNSRTKSPAASMQRRTTRAQPNASRRTSNNISDISMQTDTDTDSDEPVKKPTKSTTSSNASASTSSTQATAGSVKAEDTKSASSTAANSPSETEEDEVPLSNAKGRDYDLNQIRSELKGINELKSPSPEGDTTPTQTGTEKNQTSTSVFNFNVTEDNETKTISSSTAKPLAVGDLKSFSTDMSSETDSFADDDSQSSDKTTTLENMTEKLQQKIKAEKLAQAKCLERIGSGKTSEKITPLKSAGLEKIIKESLAEKMQETMKAKPFLIEKNIYKPATSVEKEEKSKPILEAKIQSAKQVGSKSSLALSIMGEKKLSIPILEAKSPSIRLEGRKISSIEKSPQIIIKTATQKDLQSQIETNIHQQQNLSLSVLNEKSIKEAIKPVPVTTIKSSTTDVYEFKEPEPFEFEGRKPTVIAHSNSETEKKKKTATQKIEIIVESKHVATTSPTKKNKKSPVKDQLPETRSAKQIKIEDKTQHITESSPSTLSSSGLLLSITKVENPFDALRKSPSFNLNINALNEELAATVQETAKALPDIPERCIPIALPSPHKVISSFISPFVDTANVFEMRSDDESTKSDQNGDQNSSKKTEFETVKKILLSDSTFDLEPPKIEKPSIADKVLKALNQQKQEEKIKETPSPPPPTSQQLPEPSRSEQQLPIAIVNKVETPTSQISSFIIAEPPKIELPAVIKKEIEIPVKKPILSSPEHKLDILESIAPKNNDLSETIQKLESAIQKTSNVDHFDDDSSDSTDSERRLVIEDDSQSSDNQLETNKTTAVTSAITVITPSSTNVPTAILPETHTFEIIEDVKKPPLIKCETMLNTEEIQKMSDLTTKFQSGIFGMQSIVFSDSALLSDVGVKPITDTSPIKIEITGDPKPKHELNITDSILTITANPLTSIIAISKEDQATACNNENVNIHNDSINLLLCEETIPGSPTPIRDICMDIKPNIHPIEADIKPVPMDIECGPMPCTTLLTTSTSSSSIKMTKTDGQSVENQTPGSSPRDSISQDDSSEDLKKQTEQSNDSSKKRRRAQKHSECELIFSKRRRTTTTINTPKRNGSDSEDNSDVNISQKTLVRPTRPCQYNFLVQLDPAMNPSQRISILRKKIQELRKTYNLIKAELASIERRRKKLRRRDREKKNQMQKMSTC